MWNATGIMSSSSYLSDCLSFKNIDICGLSEHWLYEKDLIFLNEINSNYMCHAVSDFDLMIPGHRRVGKGGVALLWHKKLNSRVTPLSFDDDRIIGLQLEISPSLNIYVFQVYLPCSNHPVARFYEYIDKLSNLLGLYVEKGLVLFMGDLNTKLLASQSVHPQNNRTRILTEFLSRNNMVSLNTLGFCTGARNSFVSYDNKYETLIDHILFPIEHLQLVSTTEICNDDALNVSRHRPVVSKFCLPIWAPDPESAQSSININWKKADEQTVHCYKNNLTRSSTFHSLCENNFETKSSVDNGYMELIGALKDSAARSFPKKQYKRYLKPYWTEELTTLHNSMSNARKAWLTAGQPRDRDHVAYSSYKTAKRHFRRKHRQATENFLKKQFDQIDELAEVDSGLFWHHINSRRKKSLITPGSHIKFDGRDVYSEREITDEWARYFSNLYKPSENPEFDESFKRTVSESVRRLNNEASENEQSPITISSEEVESALRLAHRGKACGDDGIYYEHILFAGTELCEILSKLFSAMIKFAHVPVEMKRGTIITLYKGGNKRRDDPDNYRAITLSSVILKLLERIILTRIELFDTLTPPIHPLQGGFQKNIGCLMSSFLLRESISYAKENGSKLYVCFLDVKKAFDCVWHDGLFYKLYKSGVNKTFCRLIVNMYTDMFSCVRNRGHRSSWFRVLQGTRQGGVISPFLYLIYKNDLLYEIETSALGFCMYAINCGSPTVADDMLVCSYSVNGLIQILVLCLRYGHKWRFEHGIMKCLVVVFNELKRAYQQSNRQWPFGNVCIEEGTQYKHLGVVCDKNMSIDVSVKDACNKLRSTFLSLVNCGIYEDGLTPLSVRRIYNAVVLPKALYGCELWSNIQSSHLVSLERAHRFCVKFMQFLPKSTSTDVALALFGFNSLETEIDYRKLIFLGQLCRLTGDHRVKTVFLHRLIHYNETPAKMIGFFPDIYRILTKYALTRFISDYIENGSFLSKYSWKKLIRAKINEVFRRELLMRVTTSESLCRLTRIHSVLHEPHILWSLSKAFPRYKRQVLLAVRLIGMLFTGKWYSSCQKCGEKSNAIAEHILLFCPSTNTFRFTLWRKLFTRFGVEFFRQFRSLSPSDQVDALFSGYYGLELDENVRLESLKILLQSLKLLSWHLPLDNLMLS